MPNTFMSKFRSSRDPNLVLKIKPFWGEQADQVIIEGEEHQEDDENQADLLSDLHFPDAEGLSQDGLQGQEKEVTSIQDRNRKEIDHPEIDAEDGGEEDQT